MLRFSGLHLAPPGETARLLSPYSLLFSHRIACLFLNKRVLYSKEINPLPAI